MEVQDVGAQPLYYGNKPRPGGVEIMTTQFSRCHVYLKPGERLRVRRGERKTANRRGALEAMLRQIWRGYRRQVGAAYPELNPRYMFIYEGRVFRIRPKAIYALTPFHYQTYLEIRNTAWCITVPLPEYTLAMNKWITTGLVTEFRPNNRDFKKLTWVPQPFDGDLPAPSAEARRHANLSK